MKIVLVYERIYFKNFEKDLERKIKSLSQSVDFDETLTLCKIREEKGEEILQKLYLTK